MLKIQHFALIQLLPKFSINKYSPSSGLCYIMRKECVPNIPDNYFYKQSITLWASLYVYMSCLITQPDLTCMSCQVSINIMELNFAEVLRKYIPTLHLKKVVYLQAFYLALFFFFFFFLTLGRMIMKILTFYFTFLKTGVREEDARFCPSLLASQRWLHRPEERPHTIPYASRQTSSDVSKEGVQQTSSLYLITQ